LLFILIKKNKDTDGSTQTSSPFSPLFPRVHL
jgi:hypothetical protein